MAVFYTGRGSGGVKLPALTNPASAAEIGEGYDAINAAGERMVGTGELAVNLAPELTAQDTLIADIMTALEGKSAASGVSVDTCTVQIENPSVGYRYGCTVYRDGSITTDYISEPVEDAITITDVVCDSEFCLWTMSATDLIVTNATKHFFTYSDFDTISMTSIRIDAPAGGVTTITF